MRTARKQGFALAIVLLVSVVALGGLVSLATLSALSSRTVSANERESTIALLSAESALNTIVARGASTTYAYDTTTYSSIHNWLTSTGLDSRTFGSGATADLAVVGPEGDFVTLRSTGTAPDGTVRVVFQDFAVSFETIDPSLVTDGALVTTQALLTNSKNSRLVGLGLTAADWTFADRTLSDARVGDYVTMTDDSGREERLLVAERDDVSGAAKLVDPAAPTTGYTLDGAPDGDGYVASGDFSEVDLTADPSSHTSIVGTRSATVTPFVVTEDVTSSDRGFNSTISVSHADNYTPGLVVAVGDCLWTIDDDGVDADAGTLTVSPLVDTENYPGYTCSDLSDSSAVLEAGTVMARTVPSAVAEGGCPDESTKTEEKLPQGCVEMPLGDLWTGTFGVSKTDLLDYVQSGGGTYYSGGDWPASVTEVTWIDGARTKGKNNELCGDGVVILNTGSSLDDDPGRINVTTADCNFEGVLYVIGKLKLVGNLDNFSGTVMTEGPGDTEVQGTGDKALFDPIAVRNALDYLPSLTRPDGLLSAVDNTYRFGR